MHIEPSFYKHNHWPVDKIAYGFIAENMVGQPPLFDMTIPWYALLDDMRRQKRLGPYDSNLNIICFYKRKCVSILKGDFGK